MEVLIISSDYEFIYKKKNLNKYINHFFKRVKRACLNQNKLPKKKGSMSHYYDVNSIEKISSN